MRKLDITTTQKVTIAYELAGTWPRIAAWFIDFTILFFYLLFSYTFISDNFNSSAPAQEVWQIIVVVIFLIYHPVSEWLMNGQSIGKKAVGLRIVKTTGQPPTINDYLIRWAFRMIDIMLSVGMVAVLLISSTARAQRLGDILSNCIVIRNRPTENLRLKDILRIDSKSAYTPTYTNATAFNDEEMLLVKSTVARARKYPNRAHRKAIGLVVEKVSDRLGVAAPKKGRVEFLETVLKDYIVLTR